MTASLTIGSCELSAIRPNVYVLWYPDLSVEVGQIKVMAWNSSEIRIFPSAITNKGHTIALNKVSAAMRLGFEITKEGKKLIVRYGDVATDITKQPNGAVFSRSGA